jgi:hypothetical protein
MFFLTYGENNMKRTLIAALFIAAPLTAQAGVGFTSHSGVDTSGKSGVSSPMEYVPTIDYKAGPVLIQVDALETMASLGRDDIMHFGLNGYFTVKGGKKGGKINNNLNGVLQVGASIDMQQNTTAEDDDFHFTNMWVVGQARMGAQASDKFGIGIYVVPGLGFARVPDSEQDDFDDGIEMATELAIGTGLQISVWMK